MRPREACIAALAVAGLAVAGCGQDKAPKLDEAAERAAATERAKKDVYGAQVKALENAKGMQDDINRKAQESVDKMEKDAK